jgi:hypothetical protein
MVEEKEASEDAQQYEVMFMHMMIGLQGACWIHLGKIQDPMTGKIERNLMLAQNDIDILMMIKQKTKNNLSDVEKSTLNGVIQQLQVNFLSEMEKQKKEGSEKMAEPGKKEGTEPTSKKEDPTCDEQGQGEDKDKCDSCKNKKQDAPQSEKQTKRSSRPKKSKTEGA